MGFCGGFGGRAWTAEGHVLVQVFRRNRPGNRVDHGDSGFDGVAADRRSTVQARPLEADFVPGIGVRDVELARYGVERHVEESRSDMGKVRDRCGSQRVGVEGKDVEVGLGGLHDGVPVAIEFVGPLAGRSIELHDQPDLGSRCSEDVVRGARQTPGCDIAATRVAGRGCREAVADGRLENRRGLIPAVEGGHVDGCAVLANRQGARRIGEEGKNLEGGSTDPGSRGVGIEDPHVGPPDAGCQKLRIARPGDQPNRRVGSLLAAVGRRDEGSLGEKARKPDISGLIANEEGARDLGRARRKIDDTHAVREQVRDPGLVIVADGHGHGFEAHGNGGRMSEARAGDIVDLEVISRRVDDQQFRSVRGEGDGFDGAALERDEVGSLGQGTSRDQQRREGARENPEELVGLLHRPLLHVPREQQEPFQYIEFPAICA